MEWNFNIFCAPPGHENQANYWRVAQNRSSTKMEKGNRQGRTLASFVKLFATL